MYLTKNFSFQLILQTISIVLVTTLLSACGGSSSSSESTSSNLETSNPQSNVPTLNSIERAFPNYVSVFGIKVRATAQVPNSKLLHAAKVLAEYLDNNDDGTVDNEQVLEALTRRKATLVMARDEAELEALQNRIDDDVDLNSLQDLQANETFPNGAASRQFDGSLEEVLHLITHLGYSVVYPEIFGEKADSAIADAMDKARGGRFESVPAKYPAGAWYTYDDKTCAYDCMVTEYTYWVLTSILGAQEFSGRFEQIQDEWLLNTKEKVRLGDPDAYAILTNQAYMLPTVLPDGVYTSSEFTIQTSNSAANTSPTTGQKNVIGASSKASCRMASENDRQACFIIKNEKAEMYGVIGQAIVDTVDNLVTNYPDVTTIVLMDVPGSEDDEFNLIAAKKVYDRGLHTELLSNSDIASGGVDFFLAGNQRTIAAGARLGVHSWGGDDGVVAANLPRDHEEHKPYIEFYKHIQLAEPSEFYFYTLNAAPAESIHIMTAAEIARWQMAR